MRDLAELFSELGGEAVQTYRQSGNAVVSLAKGKTLTAPLIEAAITERFGLEVKALLFSAKTFRALAASAPFSPDRGVDPAFLHLTFVAPARVSSTDEPLKNFPTQGDEAVKFHLGHYYLYCPHGYGRTKLTPFWFERALRRPTTTRNWRTVQALAAILAEREA